MSRADRFSTGAGRYDRSRPAYPDALLDAVARAVQAVPFDGPVADIGAGTGIFTRQLASVLPKLDVVGVEPSAAMRDQATKAGGARFLDGAAEALPFGNASIRALTAAAAAHWFDRPAFYAEAARVLAPGGVLAILDYPRDLDGSPAARAAETFLDAEGEGRTYRRPDYAAELDPLADFGAPVVCVEPVTMTMSGADYVELILSSSHARAVEARHGAARTRSMLEDLAKVQAGTDDRVRYGVIFRLILAARH